MKKIIITLTLSIFILVTSASVVFPLDRAISLPNIEKALANGKIQPRINISKKKSPASPWLYADLKLEAIDSNAYNINVSGEIMQNMYRFFANQGAAIYNGRMCIILNNGYVVDRETFLFRNTEASRMLARELSKSFYKGDTLCRIGFLYDKNVVQRDTYWKLVDTIDLPAGSTHTLNKKYTVGSSKSEQLEIGQTFGLRFGAEISTSAGIEGTFGSVKVASSLTTELNKTSEKTFTDSREITSSFESATNVTYPETDKDRIVLRYQLVDNYKTDKETFNKAVSALTAYINKDYKLAKFSPVREGKGVEVKSEEIFDVSINKEDISETGIKKKQEKEDEKSLTQGELKDKEEELNKKEEALNRKEEALNQREEELDKREEELDKKESELGKKEEAVEKKEESVEKKDEAVSQKEESVAQKEAAIDIKNSAIVKKESAIDKKEDAIDKKEEAVDKKEDAVDEKEENKKKTPPKGKVEPRAKQGEKEKPKEEEKKPADKKEEFKNTRRKAVRRKEPPKKSQPQKKAPVKPQAKPKPKPKPQTKPKKTPPKPQSKNERLKRQQAVKRKQQQQNQPKKDQQKQKPQI